MIAFPSENLPDEPSQLNLGIKISPQSQILIRIRKSIRTIQYSPIALFMKKLLFWISFGMFSAVFLEYFLLFREKDPTSKIFFLPGFYNTSRQELALITFEQLSQFLFLFGIISIIFFIAGYALILLRKQRLTDIIFLAYILLSIIIIKNLSQNTWLLNIQ